MKEYIALHKKLEDSLPKLPKDATPEQIDSHQRALERLVRRRARGAKPGDIFTPDIREVDPAPAGARCSAGPTAPR